MLATFHFFQEPLGCLDVTQFMAALECFVVELWGGVNSELMELLI